MERLFKFLTYFFIYTIAFAIDCRTRENGVYALGCSGIFYRCFDTFAYEMNCPSGLKFNPRSAKCDYVTNVPLCQNPDANKNTLVKAMHFVQHTNELSHQPTETAKNAFSCESRSNGLYSGGEGQCLGFFWICSDNQPYKLLCPKGLVYDKRTKNCGFRSDVLECNGGIYKPMKRPGLIKSMPTGFTCVGKVDGFYETEKCSNYVIQCSGKIKLHQRCPAGLVFAKKTKRCDFPGNCNSNDKEELEYPEPHHVMFDCGEKTDGYYAIGKCQSAFIFCSASVAYTEKCPDNLYFNHHAGYCDHYDSCMREEPTSSSSKPFTSSNRRPTCTGLPNGRHAFGSCHSKFFHCENGMLTITSCPSSLAFNRYNGQCDFRENIKECNEMNELTEQDSIKSGYDTNPEKAYIADSGQTKSPFTCNGKANGYYSHGCGSTYYGCSTGRISVFECPGALKYDQSSGKCNNHDSVIECKVKSAGFCTKKPDGVYAYGCSVKYAICAQSKEYGYQCPLGHFFNEKTSACDEPENVRKCVKGEHY